MDIFNIYKNLKPVRYVGYLRHTGHFVDREAAEDTKLYYSPEKEVILIKTPIRTTVLNLNVFESYVIEFEETKDEAPVSKAKGKATTAGRSKKNTKPTPKPNRE